MVKTQNLEERLVRLPVGPVNLEGNLSIPVNAKGIVLFAHGSGSSRQSPRNRYVASVLQDAGLATLLIDLLTTEEEIVDMRTRHLRFDIGMLGDRVVGATDWLTHNRDTRHLKIGYFGASTGGGAALVAASKRPTLVGAVVSRGGRPDLAGPALPLVQAPTLLLVGGRDLTVIDMNQEAMAQMQAKTKLQIITGATHLFEEPGKLEKVAHHASEWFRQHFV